MGGPPRLLVSFGGGCLAYATVVLGVAIVILITDRAGRELAGWHIIRGRFGLPVLVDEAGRVCGPDQAERRRLTVYADDADALRLRRSGYDVGDMPIGRSREPAAAQRERIEP